MQDVPRQSLVVVIAALHVTDRGVGNHHVIRANGAGLILAARAAVPVPAHTAGSLPATLELLAIIVVCLLLVLILRTAVGVTLRRTTAAPLLHALGRALFVRVRRVTPPPTVAHHSGRAPRGPEPPVTGRPGNAPEGAARAVVPEGRRTASLAGGGVGEEPRGSTAGLAGQTPPEGSALRGARSSAWAPSREELARRAALLADPADAPGDGDRGQTPDPGSPQSVPDAQAPRGGRATSLPLISAAAENTAPPVKGTAPPPEAAMPLSPAADEGAAGAPGAARRDERRPPAQEQGASQHPGSGPAPPRGAPQVVPTVAALESPSPGGAGHGHGSREDGEPAGDVGSSPPGQAVGATRPTPRTVPAVRLPDGRSMATATAALFLGYQALAAWRRSSRGLPALREGAPWVLTLPLLRVGDQGVSRPGNRGGLLTALAGRMRGDEGDRIARALARLAGTSFGGGQSALARELCWLREGEETLCLALRPPQEDEDEDEDEDAPPADPSPRSVAMASPPPPTIGTRGEANGEGMPLGDDADAGAEEEVAEIARALGCLQAVARYPEATDAVSATTTSGAAGPISWGGSVQGAVVPSEWDAPAPPPSTQQVGADLATRAEATGWPVAGGTYLELRGVPLALRGGAPPEGDVWDAAALPWTPLCGWHPVPLLVPLGADRAEGSEGVLHVNLAALGSLLVAAGPTLGAQGLVCTLLAHLVAQTHPAQLELLVVAEPGTSLDAVASTPHLLADPIDAGDPDAVAAAFDVAEARALARRSALPQGGALPDAAGAPPPALLLAVGGLAEIAADPALASRLRDLCARGPRAGVYVVATTDDVAAVVAAGQGERQDDQGHRLLAGFRGRLTFRLEGSRESRLLLGNAAALTLAQGAVLFAVYGEEAMDSPGRRRPGVAGDEGGVWRQPLGPPARLRALAISESAIRDVCTAVAGAYQSRPHLRLLPGTAAVGDGQRAAAGMATRRERDDQDTGPSLGETLRGGTPLVDGAASAPLARASGPPDRPTSGGSPNDGEPGAADEGDRTAREGTAAAGASRGAESDTESGALRPRGPAAETIWPAGPAAEGDAAGALASGSARPRSAPVALFLLGERRAEAGGRSLLEGEGDTAPLSPTALHLLAYLALLGASGAARETIEADLWPEGRAGGKSFHKALGRLRSGLGSVLARPGNEVVRHKQGIYTLPADLCWVDAFAFRAILAEADVASEELRPALWRRAVDLYRGDLFAHDAAEWSADLRLRLHDAFTRTLLYLSRHEEARGDARAALLVALHLVDAEPDDEAAHRRVMRLHAKVGDRIAALQHYGRLVTMLRDEVGVEPDEKTVDLYRKIAAHESRVSGIAETEDDLS